MREVVYHVYYYVGTVLAEAGDVVVGQAEIVFTPTGLIEKALAAKNIVIPLDRIVAYECTGGLTRTVRIKTPDKIHKFEGAEVSGFGEELYRRIPKKLYKKPEGIQVITRSVLPKYACRQCTTVLQPGLLFCTFCGAKAVGTCTSCTRIIDTTWNVCGFCGTKVESPAVVNF